MKIDQRKRLEELLRYNETMDYNRTCFPEEYGREAVVSNIVKNGSYKVAIYGAGRTGVATYLWIREKGMELDFFIDQKGGREVLNIPVLYMREAGKKFGKENFLVLIAVNLKEYELENIKKELLYNGAKEVIVCKRENYKFEIWSKDILENRDLLLEAFDKLEDEKSREAYAEFFRVKLTRDFYRTEEYDFTEKYFCKELFDISQIDHYVCLGGYTGDSVLRFIDKNGNFESITIFEPQDKYLIQMKENFKYYSSKIQNNIHFISKEAGNSDDWKVASLDECVETVDLISMDIEGAELEAMKGARRIISDQMPILALSAYHKWNDFPQFISFIISCNPNYKFYVRKYRSYSSVPANEIVLYAIPPKS